DQPRVMLWSARAVRLAQYVPEQGGIVAVVVTGCAVVVAVKAKGGVSGCQLASDHVQSGNGRMIAALIFKLIDPVDRQARPPGSGTGGFGNAPARLSFRTPKLAQGVGEIVHVNACLRRFTDQQSA